MTTEIDLTYTMGDAPEEPPQPMRIMLKEKPAMTKLDTR